MQNLLSSESKDEINLRELFIALLAHKLIIVSTCILGVIFGGYYALNADKEFTSTAIFSLDQQLTSDFGNFANFNALSMLSGFGNMPSSKQITVDQFTGRIFIESLNEKLDFQADPYFNTYNPALIKPTWKSFITNAMGWQKTPTNTQEAMWQSIVKQYSKNILLNNTSDGAIKIIVTHVNPQRAAKIANVVMDTIIFNAKNERDLEQNKQLSFLSNTLAKALNDLEVSQSKLKEFALENSALPLENFATESLELDALREQLSRTSELHEAVAALSLMLENKTTNYNNYLKLRQKFPIVDQVEFRRVLGQNEIISSWTWPKTSSVNAVFDTLSERKNRLRAQINASQINAKRFGLALETYARLEREAKVAEAAYTVLIEQVKAQSLVTGYQPDKTEIYEYATASINPSAPAQNLILALGAVIGIFVGTGLSLMLVVSRDVYYSKNSLRNGVQARLMASFKTLLPFRNKSLDEVQRMLQKNPRSVLRDIAVEINKNATTQVVVTSSRAKMTSSELVQVLASYMQSKTIKVAMIDFSSKLKNQNIDTGIFSLESFGVTESAGHLSVLKPNSDLQAIDTLSQRNFWENLQLLNSTFDLVFLCADNNDAISLLRALQGQKTLHITLAKTKKTKITTLKQMHSFLPIQGLIYD
jgi:uncharacterized protein involved in exopolysaccharide biosynthesis